jgi:glutathionylspermidine synthase
MNRVDIAPRPHWRTACEDVGFDFHSMDGVYWDESHCYCFSSREIDELEAATQALHTLALTAVDHIIAEDRFQQLSIPPALVDYVKASWIAKEPSLGGRFDFAYDGSGPPKALEYNADTPTALLEAAVVQWQWLQEAIRPRRPEADQFNSLHEKLIANWRAISVTVSANTIVHFSCMKDSDEDRGTIEYQRDVATQAGLETRFVFVEDIGWADQGGCFVDADNERINMLYKLYPWEWLLRDAFAPHLLDARPRVVEPAWKVLLSSKALMAILWELYPGHPNLLPTFFDPWRIAGDRVRKPMYSREGANVTIYRGADVIQAPGTYGGEGWIYQAYTPIPRFGDSYAIIGSWVIGDEPAGIGMREDATPITRNTSRFVPHYVL